MVKGLKKRLILYIASLFLILLFLVMFIFYLAIEDTLSDKAKESAYSIANSIYIALDDTVFNSAQLVTYIGHDPFLIDGFFNNSVEEESTIKAYLQNIHDTYDFNVYIASFYTNRYYSKDGMLCTFNKDDPKDQWFFDLSTTDSATTYLPLINNDQGSIFLNNIQFIKNSQDETKGFVLNSTDYTKSLSKIKNSIKALKASVYVVKPDGTQVSSLLSTLNDGDDEPLSLAEIDLPRLFTNASNGFMQIIKGKTSITCKYIQEIDSYLVITQDLSTSIFYTFVVTLLIAVFILACIFLITLKMLDYSNNKIFHEASLDPLTQIYNRSVFNTKLNESLELCAHYSITSSLIFIDIDNFKTINDEMGHPVGDEILQKVAQLLADTKRKNDLLFRWGGDEFSLIARSNLENTVQLAERILNNAKNIYWKENTPISLSIGVTEILCQDTKKLVFHRVDEALYAAKINGKNQIHYK